MAIASIQYPCPYCAEFAAVTEKLLLQHVRIVHSNEPGFRIQCSFSGCARVFRNFRTYQNHLLKHPLSPTPGMPLSVFQTNAASEIN